MSFCLFIVRLHFLDSDWYFSLSWFLCFPWWIQVMLCKCVFFIYFNFVLFPMVFHLFVSLILYILFCAEEGEFPKMCGWLMKTIQVTCAKARFLEEASACCHLIQTLKCINFYILNLSFLHSLVDIYSFLGISCVFHKKDMWMVWMWSERISKELKELFSIQVYAAVPSLASCPEDSFY
jgi:hypothetical protein